MQTLTVQSELPADEEAGGTPAERTLTFARPIIGFSGSRRFQLAALGERYAPFMTLSSLDEPGLDFIVVAPGALFADYVIELDGADVSLLGLRDSEEVEVLVLVSRHPGATPTVNLMGPVVVNRRSAVASQIVLQDAGYAVAVPVDAGSARAR